VSLDAQGYPHVLGMQSFLSQDRLYVSSANVPLVYDLGMELFRDILFYPLKIQLSSQLLLMIQQERSGEAIDRLLMKRVVSMMLALDAQRDRIEGRKVYHLDFEPDYLSTSRTFYSLEGISLTKE
jgi:cullin 3